MSDGTSLFTAVTLGSNVSDDHPGVQFHQQFSRLVLVQLSASDFFGVKLAVVNLLFGQGGDAPVNLLSLFLRDLDFVRVH
jgi:hypothetical protein